ncbi:MAG TPA: peptidoglycan DD-metalloendopeptidase family protein, partial [Usitatibacter sp.]|nr:peptidoglycan DD-metalloendopeptidase family protein [Usitatibacter sp.]
PVKGKVIAPFSESTKGIDIAGKKGAPVLAAASGRVIYADAGLRGYGKLVIIRHNDTWLSAYAHNDAILVKEQQEVRKGEKIAEMGSTDADRVELHFEIRRHGKPVDPARYLPPM